MPLPTIHLIAPFHTICSEAFSHCAFTGKAHRFSQMMLPFGYRVLEYGNGKSESAAEHVTILSETEFPKFYPPLGPTESHARDAVIGTHGWNAFHFRLVQKLKERLQPKDIIAHPFGKAHEGLVAEFPQAIHVETGVGYNDAPFGCWRVFESEAWRHVHWGREDGKFENENGLNRSYAWIIPNYYSTLDWPYNPEPSEEDYVLYMGRIDPCKGLLIAGDIVKMWDRLHPDDGLKFYFAGQGNFQLLRDHVGEEICARRVKFLGPVIGKARAELTGNARCMIMPTLFIEPFGGAGVESMMTGTPLLASDWGAFTETVQNGVNGYRCKLLADWVRAIERAPSLDRRAISDAAHKRFSLETCGAQYDDAFRRLSALYEGKGYDADPS